LKARLAQTVIYMVRHDARSGAMGLIVNRPLETLPWRSSSSKPAAARGRQGSGSSTGRPGQPTRLSVPDSDDYTGPDTVKVGAGVAITAEPSILLDIVKGKGRDAPISPWSMRAGAGELGRRCRAGYWIVVPSDDGILFDDAYDTKWTGDGQAEDQPLARGELAVHAERAVELAGEHKRADSGIVTSPRSSSWAGCRRSICWPRS